MSNTWKLWKNEKPPRNTLIIAKGIFWTGLRTIHHGELYDENNNLDDSGINPVTWAYIPKENT